MWGVYIITFVFWVGIGHAGTLISAILYLFRAGSGPRSTAAEAMTVFAVMTAGLFPIIHIGRPWKFFWLIPYPNWRLSGPTSSRRWSGTSSRSSRISRLDDVPLRRADPDIAVLRDRETNPCASGSSRPLVRLAQLGPRVAALRAGVPVPGRVQYAAGALGALRRVVRLRDGAHAGLARDDLPALLRGRRHLLRLRDGVHDHHPDPEVLQPQALRHDQSARRDGQGLLLMSMFVGCAYLTEFFVAWYSGNRAEQEYFYFRQ